MKISDDTIKFCIKTIIVLMIFYVAAQAQDTITIDKEKFHKLVEYASAEIQKENCKVNSWTRFGYVAPMLTGFALQGCADARAHTARHKWHELSPLANNDFWYLGVRHGAFVAGVSFAALGDYNANKRTRMRFVKDTAAVILIGSALFDLAYSWERSGKPVMDLQSWYNHNGNEIGISKQGMVWLNLSRLAVGTYLLVK